MSVISDKANILITNEDFAELMNENEKLQSQLDDAISKILHYKNSISLLEQTVKSYNQLNDIYEHKNKKLTERIKVLEEAFEGVCDAASALVDKMYRTGEIDVGPELDALYKALEDK